MNGRERRNVILCVGVILFSLGIPFFIVKRQDDQVLAGSYPFYKSIQNNEQKEQVPKLIEQIQKRYQTEKYEVSCGDSYFGTEHMWEKKQGKLVAKEFPFIQISELVKKKLIRENFLKKLQKQEAVIVRQWDYTAKEVAYVNMKIFLAEDDFSIAVGSGEWEAQAKKFLKIKIKTEYIADYLSEKELLYQYVKYLQLEQLGDWEYKNGRMESQKGGVAVKLTQEEEYISMGIYLL